MSPLRNAFDELATEPTLTALLDAVDGTEDRRFEWQLVGVENKPLYIGVAPPGSPTADPIWRIEKYTFAPGPQAGSFVVTLIQTASGSWDGRGSLF